MVCVNDHTFCLLFDPRSQIPSSSRNKNYIKKIAGVDFDQKISL
jgi:hypothetical protein